MRAGPQTGRDYPRAPRCVSPRHTLAIPARKRGFTAHEWPTRRWPYPPEAHATSWWVVRTHDVPGRAPDRPGAPAAPPAADCGCPCSPTRSAAVRTSSASGPHPRPSGVRARPPRAWDAGEACRPSAAGGRRSPAKPGVRVEGEAEADSGPPVHRQHLQAPAAAQGRGSGAGTAGGQAHLFLERIMTETI
jgi:hypothetical protein